MTVQLAPRALPAAPDPRRVPGLLAGLTAALLVVAAMTFARAVPASAAAARVTVSPATADPDYATKLSLHGTGFQAVKGGFGGVYVLFGALNGTWQPSKGGVSGQNFSYVQDSEAKDNHGYQRFVSFQAGGTLYAANGGIVNPDGSWATTLIVPGARFPAQGRNGHVEQINCLKVQCGIITVGAHGVVDPQNETFTPINFAVPNQAAGPAIKTPAINTPAGKTPTAPKTTAAATAAPLSRTAAPASPVSPGGVVIGSGGPVSPGTVVATGPALTPVAAASHTSPSAGWWAGGIAAVLLLAGLGGRFAMRRRRNRSSA